ncbi:MAG TPA: hypothetical protein DEO70_12545 [Bacteroidales bacterium]|nr:MAG: hypothetical protein A2X11_02895 [Bacteroidetes bacterium GWE2_42_24]OFY28826.1 MAG: hypothetical protein A2X09_12240 [Bacteroidetes bacterium GWF2_43_11]HBZ67657.1 hypothetical protein [Bacteroidales bacterium]
MIAKRLCRYLSRIFIPVLAGLSVSALAQNIKQPVTLQLPNVTLARAIDSLGTISHTTFSYNPDAIDAGRKVSINCHEQPLRQVLDDLLIPLQIQWSSVQGILVLKRFPESSQKQIIISGFIRDSISGEALIGASVQVRGTSVGTATNAYGFYSISVPPDVRELVFSYMGYAPRKWLVASGIGHRFNVNLNPLSIEMAQVVVTDESGNGLPNGENPGQMKLTPVMLNQLPSFTGQKDMVKSLTTLPGIASFGDGSTLFYVRGGAADQNLLMIDEAPIYNPAHLFGFFTAIAPDAINDVEAFKGDFPARYGGRISSVVHVRTKDGNLYRTGFSGNISPYTSNFSVEGPILENKSSYYLTARISNLNWIKPDNGALTNFDFHFYDINAKLNFKLSENNRLFLTLFTGRDDFTRDGSSSLKTFGINWNNQLGALRWNHIFGQKLFSNTTFYISRYDYKLLISKELDDYWNSSIDNMMAKTDFTWYPVASHTLKFGAELGIFYINPGNVQYSDQEVPDRVPVIPKYRSRSLAVYLSDDWQLSGSWSLNLGIRLSAWYDVGPTTYYTYDALHRLIDETEVAGGKVYSWFIQPEPRLQVKWDAAPKLSFTFSYGRTVQYLQVLTNTTSPFTSLEVWAPAGPNIQPQKADQVALGFAKSIANSRLVISGGVYYRYLTGQIDYADNANLLYNEYLEAELRIGTGRAYGIEMMVQKITGRLTGWMSYTWSRSFRTTPEVNDGKEYPAFYDRPHNLTLCLSYALSPRITLSGAWYYMTGGNYTSPLGYMSYSGYTVPIYGDKNNSRMPDYHRLDLSATVRLNRPQARFQHSLMLSVYNAYGRYNPFSINNNKIVNDNGDFVVPADLSGKTEIIPTTLSAAGIIPSINYQFKF